MPNSQLILYVLQAVLALAACLAAIRLGGRAERIGGIIILVNLLLSVGGNAIFPRETDNIFDLSTDGVTALALLLVAIRFASLWLGAVMLLYAAQFSIHSYYLVTATMSDFYFVWAGNITFMLITSTLVVATALAWRRKARPAKP
jgi:hypothetical protein